ncbi:hypothetical protein PTSG_10617 [Salpingoeca rosetta]|uniref:Uncharacterized protein n=1 Tax=Salpingoeca rosetta (strain ATCC 50818 / BSB-021) TaxID=946362 RepID=F2URV7_SALR5|nr:uncharacterized protein PTSG_10617 [Salpingoeca rosetta]EGD80362.1 hypothetical protein PTSG_10617 [Salpingoeca rosetta]|eukprot:XP_004988152.1 hypothetical protein PTSG_10617 [Salpingoeca rosetta]
MMHQQQMGSTRSIRASRTSSARPPPTLLVQRGPPSIPPGTASNAPIKHVMMNNAAGSSPKGFSSTARRFQQQAASPTPPSTTYNAHKRLGALQVHPESTSKKGSGSFASKSRRFVKKKPVQGGEPGSYDLPTAFTCKQTNATNSSASMGRGVRFSPSQPVLAWLQPHTRRDQARTTSTQHRPHPPLPLPAPHTISAMDNNSINTTISSINCTNINNNINTISSSINSSINCSINSPLPASARLFSGNRHCLQQHTRRDQGRITWHRTPPRPKRNSSSTLLSSQSCAGPASRLANTVAARGSEALMYSQYGQLHADASPARMRDTDHQHYGGGGGGGGYQRRGGSGGAHADARYYYDTASSTYSSSRGYGDGYEYGGSSDVYDQYAGYSDRYHHQHRQRHSVSSSTRNWSPQARRKFLASTQVPSTPGPGAYEVTQDGGNSPAHKGRGTSSVFKSNTPRTGMDQQLQRLAKDAFPSPTNYHRSQHQLPSKYRPGKGSLRSTSLARTYAAAAAATSVLPSVPSTAPAASACERTSNNPSLVTLSAGSGRHPHGRRGNDDVSTMRVSGVGSTSPSARTDQHQHHNGQRSRSGSLASAQHRRHQRQQEHGEGSGGVSKSATNMRAASKSSSASSLARQKHASQQPGVAAFEFGIEPHHTTPSSAPSAPSSPATSSHHAGPRHREHARHVYPHGQQRPAHPSSHGNSAATTTTTTRTTSPQARHPFGGGRAGDGIVAGDEGGSPLLVKQASFSSAPTQHQFGVGAVGVSAQ